MGKLARRGGDGLRDAIGMQEPMRAGGQRHVMALQAERRRCPKKPCRGQRSSRHVPVPWSRNSGGCCANAAA